MKKLTIEQKAKAYDEAFEKSKEFYILCKKCGAKDTVDFLEDSFPELQESEDEKIRKEIINIFHSLADGRIPVPINFADIFTWLEKQGEQKPADKVEPKFHQGEWITNGDYTWKIIEVKPLDCVSVGFLIKETDEQITIAQNYGIKPEQVCNLMTIPKCSIRDIRELKEE